MKEEFYLEIAAIPLAVFMDGFSKSALEQAARRYRNFISGNSRCGEFYRIAVDCEAAVPAVIDSELCIKKDGRDWTVEGRGMSVCIGRDGAAGKIMPDVHILDSLLRLVVSYKVAESGGILIHASGAHGTVYTGPAGSGKTTSVRACAENMLGDDLVALKKFDKKWHIWSTPFSGEYEGAVKNRSELLKEIRFLDIRKGPVGRGDAFAGILRNVIFYLEDNDILANTVDCIEEVAEGTPAYGACYK